MPAGALERVARRIVAEGVIPSVQISVWRRGTSLVELAVGKARLAPPWPTTLDTPYDLASVTKPLVGAGVAAALVERGTLDLDAPVADTLRDVDPRITARMLLNHSSGYPAWAPLYEQVDRELWGTGEARRQIFAAARRVSWMDREIRSGRWSRAQDGLELNGRTLGLVGFGQVARRVSLACQAIGMQVRVFDPLLAAGSDLQGAERVESLAHDAHELLWIRQDRLEPLNRLDTFQVLRVNLVPLERGEALEL